MNTPQLPTTCTSSECVIIWDMGGVVVKAEQSLHPATNRLGDKPIQQCYPNHLVYTKLGEKSTVVEHFRLLNFINIVLDHQSYIIIYDTF